MVISRAVYRIGIFRSVSVGISQYLPYRYWRKSWSVHFGMIFLAGNPISLKKGAMAPFLRKKGAPAPFLIQPAPLMRKKGVPAKLVIPTGNTDRQINLIRYRQNTDTEKTAGSTVLYNSSYFGKFNYFIQPQVCSCILCAHNLFLPAWYIDSYLYRDVCVFLYSGYEGGYC